MRPKQWVKNLFVLAPVVFAKNLFHEPVLLRALAASAAFSMLSGAIYTINDLVDVEDDRRHPTKRLRPVASGDVPVGAARVAAGVLIALALAGSFAIGPAVGVAALSYLALNLAYSLRLKQVAYLDVACIAAGFVLRVVAGSYAVSTVAHPVRPSLYLLLSTGFLALFLGFGKRAHELEVNEARARSSLRAYKPRTLRAVLWAFALLTVAVYLAWTLDPPPQLVFARRYLWITTSLVLVAMSRFVKLLRSPDGESPTDAMLRDVPFVVTVLGWAVLVVTIVYQLRPTG
jgi:decaprenyl-phosphate phosphoribosyltransferase